MAGKPQTLSKGQKEEVGRILRKQFVAGFLLVLMLMGGIGGWSLWEIWRKVENKMESLVAKQFEEPRIQKVVKEAASERADRMMLEGIQPEVRRFKGEVDKQLIEIQKAVDKAAKLAAPPILSLSAKEIVKSEKGYTATLQFTPSKNELLATIVFEAFVIGDNQAKIIDLWPSKGSSFRYGDNSKKISSDGKEARLVYAIPYPGGPTIDLKVTESCEVRIEGNYLTDPVIIKFQ